MSWSRAFPIRRRSGVPVRLLHQPSSRASVSIVGNAVRVRRSYRCSRLTSPEGASLRHSTFTNRIWKPTLEQLKLPPVGIHVLRHSAAARMIQLGVSPKAVQSVLGYACAAFTLTVYGHMLTRILTR